MMIRTLLLLLLIMLCPSVFSQSHTPTEVFRAEGIPYANRHDAKVGGDLSLSDQYIAFNPELEGVTDSGDIVLSQRTEIPYVWTDGLVMVHLESVGQPHSFWVNGKQVLYTEDGFSPAEYDITSYIRQGVNDFKIVLCEGKFSYTQKGLSLYGVRFAGSYLFSQQRRSIADYSVRLVPDSLRRFGVLELDIVVRNAFNYEEQVNPAYDIYSPDGKLRDYTDRPVQVQGRSQDTIRLNPFIYHTNEQKWGEGKAPLYDVMLFTKRDGKMWEYMPLKVGFSDISYKDGKWQSFGKELELKPTPCNARKDRATTKADMLSLRKQGFNTLRPSYPQPSWYYELADELGLYVIDCAAISAPDERDNRKVGGTPANDPELVDEFVSRVRRMYYRSRNHSSVIGFSLGNPSGNGYAMYKAYEWFKSLNEERPIFYEDARGEWNSD